MMPFQDGKNMKRIESNPDPHSFILLSRTRLGKAHTRYSKIIYIHTVITANKEIKGADTEEMGLENYHSTLKVSHQKRQNNRERRKWPKHKEENAHEANLWICRKRQYFLFFLVLYFLYSVDDRLCQSMDGGFLSFFGERNVTRRMNWYSSGIG